MPRVESSVTIAAPRERVIAVARDIEGYPAFMDDVESITVVEKSDDGRTVTADWVGVVKKFNIKVRWTERDEWDVENGVSRFSQVKGDYDQFEGEWRFTDTGDGHTRFDSVLDYRLEIPLVGPLVKQLVHKIIQANLDSTLAAIKQRSESA
jgi:uncharacterized membrane protein